MTSEVRDSRGTRRQLAIGIGALVLTALPATHTELPRLEAEAFEAVNQLPDALFVPIWPVMQLGALGAVPVVAGLAAATGHTDLARRLAITGTTTWVGAKVVKRCVRRGRPSGLIPDVRVRGRAQTGEGFLSGHAGIATALAAATIPELTDRRVAVASLAVTVAIARVYVGAHLPLDVVGGAALGLTVDAAVASLGNRK